MPSEVSSSSLQVDDSVLAPAGEMAPAPTPELTYRGGPLLTSAEVLTIFWGAAWTQRPQAGLVADLNDFFDFVLTSELMDQLAEYSVSGQTIGQGKCIGTQTLSSPAPPKTVSDTAIQRFLQQQLTAKKLPQPTQNSLYFVYLPPGVTVSLGGGRSCLTFCGYHDTFGQNVFYAVMPYPGC